MFFFFKGVSSVIIFGFGWFYRETKGTPPILEGSPSKRHTLILQVVEELE